MHEEPGPRLQVACPPRTSMSKADDADVRQEEVLARRLQHIKTVLLQVVIAYFSSFDTGLYMRARPGQADLRSYRDFEDSNGDLMPCQSQTIPIDAAAVAAISMRLAPDVAADARDAAMDLMELRLSTSSRDSDRIQLNCRLCGTAYLNGKLMQFDASGNTKPCSARLAAQAAQEAAGPRATAWAPHLAVAASLADILAPVERAPVEAMAWAAGDADMQQDDSPMGIFLL